MQVNKKTNTLNDTWTFWYAPRGKNIRQTDDYFQNLTSLGDVTTVEDFYSYYCYLRRPTEIPIDHKILLFRKSCKPLWENWKDGGCWIIQFKKKDSEEILNKTWEYLLFSLIGEGLEDEEKPSNILGGVLSIRGKRDIIEIWVRDGKDEDLKIQIGEKIRDALSLNPNNLTFYFKVNSKSLIDKSMLKGAESYTFISTPLETPMTTPLEALKDGRGGMEDLSI